MAMLFDRWPKSLQRKPGPDRDAVLPDNIVVALITSLFEAKSALVVIAVSVVTAVLVALKVAVDAQNTLIFMIADLLACLGIARLVTVKMFPKGDGLTKMTTVEARRWERVLAALTWSYCAVFGMLAFVTFTQVDQAVDNLLVDATACGMSAGIISRSAGRPKFALGQLILLLMPIFFAGIWKMQSSYFVFAVLNLLFLIASTGMVRGLHGNMVRLLLATHEKSTLAESLATKNLLLDTALGNMSHGLCFFDDHHRIVVANTRFQELFKLPLALTKPGVALRDVVAFSLTADGRPEMIDAATQTYIERLSSGNATSSLSLTPDGRWISMSQRPLAAGGAIVLFNDITDSKRMEERVAHMAHHDALTDLPNRVSLHERLAHDLAVLQPGSNLNLFCVDLDRFKAVNDTLGHAAGDALLCEAAQRLTAELSLGMIAARIGGDEFVILAGDMDAGAAIAFSERVIAAVSKPYRIDSVQASVGASIGVACAFAGCTLQELFRRADAALYDAKKAGRGTVCVYSSAMDAAKASRQNLEDDFRRAIQNEELTLSYQPRFDKCSNRIVCVEALAHWSHPMLGMVEPEAFVALAEETGLIMQLGAWVLRKACRDAAAWGGSVRIAINVSPAQLADSALAALVLDVTLGLGLDPKRLQLEVAGSLPVDCTNVIPNAVASLRDLGVRITVDDFGGGFSSLVAHRAFTFDGVKVGRPFIHELDGGAQSLAIVRSSVALAHELGMTAVAVGVETRAQFDLLHEVGFDEFQGVHFALPMPSTALMPLLHAQAPGHRNAA